MNERKDHITSGVNPEIDIKEMESLEKGKINLETAKMPWKELQRFFAAGQVFEVAVELDLTDVALNMSQDNTDYLKDLISRKLIDRVSDQRAIEWFDSDALVWCVVVKPYILVQGLKTKP